jgi:hypothetical protein
MPDLEDLEHTWSVLEARADAHPLREFIVPERPGRSHRTGLMIAAGATVAAVAVGVVIIGTRSPSANSSRAGAGVHSNAAPAPTTSHPVQPTTTTAPAPAGTDWSQLPTGHYLVVPDGMPGARFRSVIGVGTPETQICAHDTYQEVQIVGAQGGFVVKVNQPGTWQPTGGDPLTIDGRPAFYGKFLRHPEIPGHPVPPRVSLAWQYAPNAWATIGSIPDPPPISLATAKQVESELRIAVGEPIPSPPDKGYRDPLPGASDPTSTC